jgi:hypothetical protein
MDTGFDLQRNIGEPGHDFGMCRCAAAIRKGQVFGAADRLPKQLVFVDEHDQCVFGFQSGGIKSDTDILDAEPILAILDAARASDIDNVTIAGEMGD